MMRNGRDVNNLGPQSDGYQVAYDPESDESLSVHIVKVVSSLTGRPADELEVLDEVIDPDALNSLFDSTNPDHRDSGHVTFPYEGVEVTVNADGEVIVRNP